MESTNAPSAIPCNVGPLDRRPRAIIIGESASLCATNRCDTLLEQLRVSACFAQIQAISGDRLPVMTSFSPDIVLLMCPIECGIQKLIDSCKEQWKRAALLAVVCPGFNRPTNEISSALNSVDDFLSCPYHESELLLRIRRLLQSKGITADPSEQPGANEALHFGALVGESEVFVRAIKNILPLAQSDATVLICGETGTGKELFSRAIHYQSPRRGKAFMPVNCAALPDHLFENELFGHSRGAYTDASSAEKGLVAEAEGGTLLLDEVDALSLPSQAKLLRFLQDGEYRPLGASRSITADVRIIASTNSNLLEKVKSKHFREDLYYRLSSLSILVPPLRDRIEDVLHLANHFIIDFAAKHKQEPRSISNEALRRLLTYSWPGNVRELEGVILRALVLTTSGSLQPQDLHIPENPIDGPAESGSFRQIKSRVVQSFERNYLIGLLAAHRGNITRAAIAAGKQRRTFQRLLFKYAIDRHSFQL